MYFEAVAIAAELRDFPGGSVVLARSIMPTIEALRIIRWPADRLDTLGGYLAYHNVTLFTFFLALYLGIQGARLIRTLEERGDLDFLLASGLSRSRIALTRSVAMIIALVVISLGLGVGTAVALEASGEPNTSGAILTLLAGGICILPFFGLGYLLSHFFISSRVASSVTSVIITVIYLVGNISGKYGWLNWFEYLSPFSYANRSRPVVPGFEVDYLSWFFVAFVALIFIGVGTRIFSQRDINSTTKVGSDPSLSVKRRRPREIAPRSLLSDMLWRQRYGLIAWPLTTAVFIAVFVSMMPGIIDIWEQFEFLQQFGSSGFGDTAELQYLAMVYEILPPFLAGLIITQGSIWNNEFLQRRLQLIFSTPTSWMRLSYHRLLTTLIIAQAMILLSIAAVLVFTSLQGTDPYFDGALRVWVMLTLFVLALTSTIGLLVVLMRGRNVTQILSVYIGAAWLVGFMAPYLGWPEWIVRLSIFDAFGHPFIAWPTNTNFIVIMGMIVIGATGSLALGSRMPRVN